VYQWLAGENDMALRCVFLTLFVVCLSASPLSAAADNPSSIEVWKSATCECCVNWVKHLEANGFVVKVNATEPEALEAYLPPLRHMLTAVDSRRSSPVLSALQ
jgi:hypothetical protein